MVIPRENHSKNSTLGLITAMLKTDVFGEHVTCVMLFSAQVSLVLTKMLRFIVLHLILTKTVTRMLFISLISFNDVFTLLIFSLFKKLYILHMNDIYRQLPLETTTG